MKKTLFVKVFFFAVVLLLIGMGCSKSPSEVKQQTNLDESKVEIAVKQEMVDCSQSQDPYCFLSRMSECLPVTTKMMGSDGKTSIEIMILGVENEKCHFQRKINNVQNMNCFFPKGTLNSNTLDQMFGNEKGLKKVVDDACTPVGW